jgi:FkbM family methyltransferase
MCSASRELHAEVLRLNGGSWFNFEPHLTALYRAILKPGMVALDGGANIGVHTLQMALSIAPDGMVIAVEPVAELRQRLNQRREEHGMPSDWIRMVPFGLWDNETNATFYQVLHPVEHELSGLRRRDVLDRHTVQEIQVPLTSVDSLCQNLERLDYLKLDIEGAEYRALHGAVRTLRRFRPVISLEQSQRSPDYFGYTWDDLVHFFDAAGYEVYDLFGFRYTDPPDFYQCEVWDFVAFPVERAGREEVFAAVRMSMLASGVRLP